MDKISAKEYAKRVEKKTPNSKTTRNCIRAFLVGGLICCIGQAIYDFAYGINGDKNLSAMIMSMTMIFLGALSTGLNIYDDIGRFAGAGSIVPITGFANSIVAPAMEFRSEGFIMGVGAKMFVISGPVIVYGVVSSVLVGLIYYFVR